MNFKGFNTSRHDYNHPLKYYRIVRQVIAKQQGLTTAELERLIFLDDEYFTKFRFGEAFPSFNWHPYELQKLIDMGWIEMWRDYKPPKQAALFRPTPKTHHLVKRIYRILDGKEDLPMSERRNPIMKDDSKLTPSDKLLKDAILLMHNDKYKNRYEDG